MITDETGMISNDRYKELIRSPLQWFRYLEAAGFNNMEAYVEAVRSFYGPRGRGR